MLRTVYLHGEAGNLFGKKWRLDVASLAEACRAIGSQCKNFQTYIELNHFQCVMGPKRKGVAMGEDMVNLRLGKNDLHITPVFLGAGGKGKMGSFGKIIAGVFLAGFAFFAAPGAAVLGMSAKSAGMMGIGLIGSGVSSLLSAQEKTEEKDDASKLFSNIPGVAAQGFPVPLIFGRVRIDNPPVISSRIVTTNVSNTDTGTNISNAKGTATFSGNPANNTYLTLNGFIVTFKSAAGGVWPTLSVSENYKDTIDDLVDALNKSKDPKLKVATYSRDNNKLKIWFDDGGAAGNAYTMSETTAVITLSGATLTGGF